MSSPAKDIADHLKTLGVGVSTGNVFLNEEPTSPNVCVTIYDTGGTQNVVQDIALFEPTIQIRVRHTSQATGYAWQEDIRDALILPLDFQINGFHYIGVWLQSDIISLGKDQNNRWISTSNYRLQRQPL